MNTDEPTPEAPTDDTASPEQTPEPEPGMELMDAIKVYAAKYIIEHIPPGDDTIRLDLTFAKDHLGPLISYLFENLARAFMPETFTFRPPVITYEDGQIDTDAEVPTMKINFDLGSVIGELFAPPKN